MKLTIELVPSTAWNLSLYRLLPKTDWYAIKREVFSKEGRRCFVCGSEIGTLAAHEFWEYDDQKHIQKLIGIHHLCDLCHKVKHIGFWCHTPDGIRALRRQGVSREDIVEHFCKVNQCTMEEFREHEDRAFQVWSERSEHGWKQDFGKYKDYVEKTHP